MNKTTNRLMNARASLKARRKRKEKLRPMPDALTNRIMGAICHQDGNRLPLFILRNPDGKPAGFPRPGDNGHGMLVFKTEDQATGFMERLASAGREELNRQLEGTSIAPINDKDALASALQECGTGWLSYPDNQGSYVYVPFVG
jgi:hypothetical protein